MIVESYDKYEFKLLECAGYSPTQLIRKLNELGQEGWQVVQSYGSLFKSLEDTKILMERKINCVKM